MNSDDLMSDPGQSVNYVKPGTSWNTKKFNDEYEAQKHRLQDQRFSVGKSPWPTCDVVVKAWILTSHEADYPDPLAPRSSRGGKQYPKGTNPELESKLQELIAQVKASAAGVAT